jgi:hypothetical protein
MRTTILSKENIPVRRVKEKTRSLFFNLHTLNLMIFFFIVFLCVIFIATKNDVAIKGFVINDMEKKLSVLEKQHLSLELDALNKQSMFSINKKASLSSMVSVGDISFIDAKSNTVAKK